MGVEKDEHELVAMDLLESLKYYDQDGRNNCEDLCDVENVAKIMQSLTDPLEKKIEELKHNICVIREKFENSIKYSEEKPRPCEECGWKAVKPDNHRDWCSKYKEFKPTHCEHEWKQSDRAVVFTYCLKCKVVSSKPSDCNPCSPSPEAMCENCKTGEKVNPWCGIHHAPCDCKPEARVDWDKVVDEEFGAVMHHEIGEEAWRITKVCKAAYEAGVKKGEAR